MDIIDNSSLSFSMLNTMASNLLSSDYRGVSVNSQSKIHLPDDATQQTQDVAQAIFDNYDTLSILSTITNMTEGNPTDPIITNQVALADSQLGYIVTFDGEVYDEGTTPTTAGIATLNLVDPVAGEYIVYLYRLEGNFASGLITITVNEDQS